MKIEQILNIPAAFIYNRIVETELFDIQAQTGHRLTADQLAGFSYEKKLEAGEKATVSITRNVLNRSFHYEMLTKHYRRKIYYDFKPITAASSKIIYEERNTSLSLWQQIVDVTRDTLLGSLKRHNFRKMFLQIEKSY
jgi:hypothetical protein